VADEIALTHPHGHADLKDVLVIVGGPALYLLGTALFKRLTAPNLPLSHLVCLGLLVALGIAGGMVARLHLATATTVILIVVAVWEWASLTDRGRRPPAHGR
jgi:low temperature requirement protein LtrA